MLARTALRLAPLPKRQRVVACRTPRPLSLVADGLADLGIWLRDLDPLALADLDALPPVDLPQLRCEGPVDDVAGAVAALKAPAWLRRDAADLVRTFAGLTGLSRISAKLDPVATDACRKLHHDQLPLRMLCVYRGRGTQFLPPEREARIGSERTDIDDRLLEIVPRGAVMLFTGAEDANAQPVLHRSPRIGGTGEVRLVLCLNEPLSSR
jgi:Protein of unknown function (DUF1826)